MSVVPFTCPIPYCKFHCIVIDAEIAQSKAHIKHDHDYQELLETAFDLGIIHSLSERRSVIWLVNELFQAGRRRIMGVVAS